MRDTGGEASEVLLWAPTHGHACEDRPARTY